MPLQPAEPRRFIARASSCSLALLLACTPPPAAPAATPTPTSTPTPTVDADAIAEAKRVAELPHQIVFADRITYSYVLLLPGAGLAAPTRDELDQAVREAFPKNLDDEEVELLRGLIARPIDESPIAPKAAAEPEEEPETPAGESRRASDLLGLAIEVHARVPASGPPLIEPRVLDDPDLARALEPTELASIPTRGTLLVLRAQYRNQHGVRGLRLLQTLVRVIASKRGALIHDPDTLETLGPAAFAARRLQTSLGNVADQIPIIPFADPAHPGKFRLTTRGMRRFGSVDLELGGLPGDLSVLQQATYFLHGLARQMIDLGEFDRSGFAVELPDILTLHYSDCAAAYAGHPGSLPRCSDCPERVELHLVERAPEPQDAVAHVVARIVAPRSRSDRGDYDAVAWAQEALDHVLGRPPM
jgi:hypothetical protein